MKNKNITMVGVILVMFSIIIGGFLYDHNEKKLAQEEYDRQLVQMQSDVQADYNKAIEILSDVSGQRNFVKAYTLVQFPERERKHTKGVLSKEEVHEEWKKYPDLEYVMYYANAMSEFSRQSMTPISPREKDEFAYNTIIKIPDDYNGALSDVIKEDKQIIQQRYEAEKARFAEIEVKKQDERFDKIKVGDVESSIEEKLGKAESISNSGSVLALDHQTTTYRYSGGFYVEAVDGRVSKVDKLVY